MAENEQLNDDYIGKCAECKDQELPEDQILDATSYCKFCNAGSCDDHIGLWDGEPCCQSCHRKFSGVDDA